MTVKIMPRINHAARCANRRSATRDPAAMAGSRNRILVKTTRATSTKVANRSSMNPSPAQWPMPKSALNNAPYASTIVRPSTRNAQNVNA